MHISSRLYVAGLALALGAVGSPAIASPRQSLDASHVMGLHRRHNTGAQQSLNWAGYVRTGKSFTKVSGSWTVPTLKTTYDGYSSTWVGIDGATASDRYLIQTGTEADVSGGRRTYRAWWEVITPTDVAPEVVFPALVISPGDSVSASVYKLSSGRWTMRVRDNTTGHSASHTVDFDGPGATAEWIQEDTDVNGYISSAPNWGTVTFRRLLLNGESPHLLPSESVDIIDRDGTRETSTSAPTPAGSSFTVTWVAPGTRTRA